MKPFVSYHNSGVIIKRKKVSKIICLTILLNKFISILLFKMKKKINIGYIYIFTYLTFIAKHKKNGK